jgi:hypothetical protein
VHPGRGRPAAVKKKGNLSTYFSLYRFISFYPRAKDWWAINNHEFSAALAKAKAQLSPRVLLPCENV